MLDTIASHTTATLAGLEDARLPTDTDLLTMRSTPLVSESDASLSSYFDVNMVSTTMALLQDNTPTTSLSEYSSNSLHITDPMKTELYETPSGPSKCYFYIPVRSYFMIARSTNPHG